MTYRQANIWFILQQSKAPNSNVTKYFGRKSMRFSSYNVVTTRLRVDHGEKYELCSNLTQSAGNLYLVPS